MAQCPEYNVKHQERVIQVEEGEEVIGYMSQISDFETYQFHLLLRNFKITISTVTGKLPARSRR